jgi:hypothetical protein
MASAGDLSALAFLMNQEVAPSMGLAPSVLLAITFTGVAINLIYLSLMPGQSGPNAYGPDPSNGIGAMPGIVPQTRGGDMTPENDPVKRALADYQARQAAAAKPVVAQANGAARPSGSAATFGKKR